MKIVGKVVLCFFLIIAGLISSILGFIEIRFLIAQEFLLMNSPALAFVGYLLRFIFFLMLFVYNFFLLIGILFNKKTGISNFFIVPSLIIASIFSIFFYSTYIFFLVFFISLVPVIAVATKKFLA